ncbi:maleylpyruvate isomerase family mycothiol-dependent enzyme [Longispora albida]|uniref:maleylpyruvate isomerase family mycothiol-dependent enzyme n=1 Tax=Longispora albida TaxID=203523 RepID=UPI00037A5D96|nr:maleylpyruvate isomerase family mycothiol-dependent enzyme [Longispora albida]
MAPPKHADAWRHTFGASVALAGQFAPHDWGRPTDCPAWTVHDIVAHLIGAERWTMGEPLPDYQLPDLPHVGKDFDRWTEIPVQLRKGLPPAVLVAELKEVYELRSAQIGTLDGTAETSSPWGYDMAVDQAVAIRVLDCWAHEQDLRRAVNRPGNLDSPAARVARATFLRALPKIVARVGGPGDVVRFDVTGALPFSTDIEVDADGMGFARGATGRPAVTLSMGWDTFARLCCGRVPANRAPVTYTGNAELGLRVAMKLAVTP